VDFLALLWLVALLPFLGAALNGVLGPRAPRSATTAVALGAPGLSLLIALGAIWQYVRGPNPEPFEQVLYQWTTGALNIDIAFRLDPLSAVMLFVVTFVGFLIHVYSVGYMAHEQGYQRYFAYLNLFMGAMLLLILGNNYLVLFFGWEGVGLCSYLLIGYYYDQEFPPYAGRKAFIVNRIGDFAFLVGMFALIAEFGTLNFSEIFGAIAADPHRVEAEYLLGMSFAGFVTLCLFIGAVGKSAQIPLFVWLPDAMAGPTPVSALIHAATMVTAGVYMVARSNALFQLAPGTSALVAVTGAVTALFAATIGLAQRDIKKVLAYSTVSQLGYMFLAAGVGAYSAAIFHVGTHAFFKALLFLGSGSVIHAMSGEQDMFKMGGLKKKMKVTYWTFLIGALAIAGVPPLAGFFSKDLILAKTFEESQLLWVVGWITAGLTATYMFRAVYLTFHGEFRGTEEQRAHVHESPGVMTVPLVILAIGSIVVGWIGFPRLGHFDIDIIQHFLDPVIVDVGGTYGAHHLSLTMELVLMGLAEVALFGILIAWKLWGKKGADGGRPAAERFPRLYRTLFNKYWIDELYDSVVVRPLAGISQFCRKVIDGIFVEGAVHTGPFLAKLTGDIFRFTTTGNVRNYLLYFFAGLLVLFWWVVR
jgi:NADH-quinone oxidoreductase subunit L